MGKYTIKTNKSSTSWENIKRGLIDLKTKRFGKLIFLSPLDKNIKFMFGPYKDFLKFEMIVDKTNKNLNGTYESKPFAARYIKFDTNEENLKVVFVPMEFASQPVGKFKCSDDVINRIYEVGRRTIEICSIPHYTGNSTINLQREKSKKFARTWRGKGESFVIVDGARRDREVWVGDLLPEIKASWYCFNNKEVILNSLNVILDQLEDDGHIPASSISMQIFYEYNCWFLIVFDEYLKLSGDVSFLHENIDALKKITDFILEKLDQRNLLNLGTMQTWAWTSKREGYITSSQCVMAHSLEKAAGLMDMEGMEEYSNMLIEKSKNIKKYIRGNAFDKEKGAFLDVMFSKDEKRYSLDANSLAIMFGIANKEQAKSSLDFIKDKLWTKYGSLVFYPKEKPTGNNWPHNEHIWPFCVGFELEARFMSEDKDNALDLLRRTWGTMIKNNADTFWEIIDKDTGEFMKRRLVEADDDRDTWNSASHGWSAGPVYLIQNYIAGIRPYKDSYDQMIIDPMIEEFEYIESTYRTKNGKIYLNFDNNILKLDLPDNVECINKIDALIEDQKGKVIKIDDNIVSGEYRVYSNKVKVKEEVNAKTGS